MMPSPPTFPHGEYVDPGRYDDSQLAKFIDAIEKVPNRAKSMVDGMTDEQLDTKYRNWTIRQIIHHLADSHINCYVRFRWALTESKPTIKAYNESLWSELEDARTAPLESSLTILAGIHQRWGQLLRRLERTQLDSTFFHPEMERHVSLAEALPSYVWHADHHLGQIQWIKDQNGW